MTLDDSRPVPSAAQCRILVPTAGRYIVPRQKPAIPFTVLQQNPLLIYLCKNNTEIVTVSQKTITRRACQLSLETGHEHSVNKFLILHP